MFLRLNKLGVKLKKHYICHAFVEICRKTTTNTIIYEHKNS